MTAINTDTTDFFAPPADSKERVSQFMKQVQDEICAGLEELDGSSRTWFLRYGDIDGTASEKSLHSYGTS